MEQLITPSTVHQFTPATAFTLICGGRVVTISFDELVRVEKKGRQALLYTKESIYRTHRSLEEIMKELPVNNFVRITTRHIIALAYVTRFGKNFVFIYDTLLPMTRNYKKQLIRLLGWQLNQSYQTLTHASRIRTTVQ